MRYRYLQYLRWCARSPPSLDAFVYCRWVTNEESRFNNDSPMLASRETTTMSPCSRCAETGEITARRRGPLSYFAGCFCLADNLASRASRNARSRTMFSRCRRARCSYSNLARGASVSCSCFRLMWSSALSLDVTKGAIARVPLRLCTGGEEVLSFGCIGPTAGEANLFQVTRSLRGGCRLVAVDLAQGDANDAAGLIAGCSARGRIETSGSI
jgi:hypothetical protein